VEIDIGAAIAILLPAALAALGYVTKLLIAGYRQWRHERAQTNANLLKLQSMLQASRTAFLVQNELAVRLTTKLQARFPDEHPSEPGFERLFGYFFGRFDREEADLHGIIRGYTEHALRPINQALLSWLQADTEFRVAHGKKENAAELSRLLNQLDSHLRLWLAKYEAWLPDRPTHALVYLNDEARHGVGFPKGLDRVVDAVIRQTQPTRTRTRS
jgi:hypothetical protein